MHPDLAPDEWCRRCAQKRLALLKTGLRPKPCLRPGKKSQTRILDPSSTAYARKLQNNDGIASRRCIDSEAQSSRLQSNALREELQSSTACCATTLPGAARTRAPRTFGPIELQPERPTAARAPTNWRTTCEPNDAPPAGRCEEALDFYRTRPLAQKSSCSCASTKPRTPRPKA